MLSSLGFQAKLHQSNERFKMIRDQSNHITDKLTAQSALLSLLGEKNYSEFALILKTSDSASFNPARYFYEEPDSGTLLDIACRSKGNCRFVKLLILYDAQVDLVNSIRGKAPIHEAIETNDVETVEVLCRDYISSAECNLSYEFQRKGCDINVTDSQGRNAVMVAAYFARYDILSVILKNPQLVLDPVGEKTVLHSLVDGWMEIGQRERTDDENNKYYQCLDCIFTQAPCDELHELLAYIEWQPTYYTNENDNDRNAFFKMYLVPRLEKYKITKLLGLSSDHTRKSFRTQQGPQPSESPTPSQSATLLAQLKNKELENFKATLASDASTVNFFYRTEDGTLLDIACRSSGYSQFIDVILTQPGIDVNALNEKTGRAAIHEAVRNCDFHTLHSLLGHVDCDVNLTCVKGFSPVDHAAIHKRTDLIDILFDYGARKPQITAPMLGQRVNLREMQKIVAMYTPIMRSAWYGNYQTFRKLRQTGVSVEPTIDRKTIMHMVLDGIMASKYQNNVLRLQQKHYAAGKDEFDCEKDTLIQPLNFTLFADEQRDHHGLLKYFMRGVDQLQYVNYTDRHCNTALHYAVAWEDKASIEALLAAGAHTCIPNKHGTIPLRSLSRAALEKHLDHSISSGNRYSTDHSEYAIIFDYSSMFSVCRNGTLGRYADADRRMISNSDEDLLLDNENIKFDDEAVYLKPDEKVKLGMSNVCHQVTREIEPILIMQSEPELRPLLKHPLVRSYLDIKWNIVGKYFKYNVALYFIYWLLLSSYLYYEFEEFVSKNNTRAFNSSKSTSFVNFTLRQNCDHLDLWASFNSTSTNSTFDGSIINQSIQTINYGHATSSVENVTCHLVSPLPCNQSDQLVLRCYPHTFEESPAPNHTQAFDFNIDNALYGNFTKIFTFPTTLVWLLIIFTCTTLLVRELFQAYMLPKEFFKSPENWLEMSLFVSTFVLLLASEPYDTSLRVFVILASCLELVLLLGRHPYCSTHIEMLKTVSMNFFKFLILYSIMIAAFAFSFYILFKRKCVDLKLKFCNLPKSFFTTLIMLTGEYESGSLSFDRTLDTEHLVFIIFVILISVILFNLLNGLAVGDTQKILLEAETVGILSRIKFIQFVEKMAQDVPIKLHEKISLKHYLGRYFLKVFPKSGRAKPKKVKIDRKIIDDAVKIVQKINQQQEFENDNEYRRFVEMMLKQNRRHHRSDSAS